MNEEERVQKRADGPRLFSCTCGEEFDSLENLHSHIEEDCEANH